MFLIEGISLPSNSESHRLHYVCLTVQGYTVMACGLGAQCDIFFYFILNIFTKNTETLQPLHLKT